MVVASPLIRFHADRSGAKRAWLIFGLAGALLGSLMLALATSRKWWLKSADDISSQAINASALFTLFTGRFVQSLASTGLCVVEFATLAENVPADELGKMYGVVTIAIGVGTSGGPPVAGSIGRVTVDLLARSGPDRIQTSGEGGTYVTHRMTQINSRFVGGVVSYFCYAVLTASFVTTLPLHAPAVFFSVPVSWLKDRVGTRYPTTIGVAVTGTGIVICFLNGVGLMEATQAVDEIEGKNPGIFGPDEGVILE
ncbi:Major facilitator superfamily domain, general substrate transporter [Penicillium italicum]|uniref:Major facilitator superfamily domain, general substrate transporter n=1 Tax=Penicillium italicum TaxID=40296 RepID=A0A0A2L8M6_PENIT|nr:Major facilitator superfamily domain, general substrate transporter [Penicillium italicum]